MTRPRRGDIWTTDTGVTVLVISSTVYNDIASEPTVVVPVFEREPGTGFGVDLGDGWAIPGLVASLRKTRLRDHQIQMLRTVHTPSSSFSASPAARHASPR